MVNNATARFHCKIMQLLRMYYVIAVTTDGLLVLAGRDVPHLSCVPNPFMGYMVHFAARMHPSVVAAVVSGASPPYLVIYCNDSKNLYRANPESESFVRYKKKYAYPLVRKAVQGCIATDGHQGVLPPLPAAVVTKIADMMTPFFQEMLEDEMINDENIESWKRCFLVESAGETLLENSMEIFKVEMDGNTLEQVHSIGNRAIFIGTIDSIITLLFLYTLNWQSSQAARVLEHEDRLLEQLRTGELSISDLLLQVSQEDTDSESSDD
ncbi:hypothetical protein ACQ4PT_000506 [Festuca glaucescens]